MAVFEIKCYVDDKKLGETLRALAAVGAMNVVPTPVGNAERGSNGKVRAQHQGGNPAEMFMQHLLKAKVDKFYAHDFKAFLRQMGRSVSSYSHHLNSLKELGLVRTAKRKDKGMGLEWHVADKAKSGDKS